MTDPRTPYLALCSGKCALKETVVFDIICTVNYHQLIFYNLTGREEMPLTPVVLSNGLYRSRVAYPVLLLC